MPGTPYITPAMLQSTPAGISWTVIPKLTATTAEQAAQLLDVCWKATSEVESYCNQPLRATIHTEMPLGPGQPRFSVDRCTGIGTLIARKRFVSEVLALSVSPARSFPPAWAPVPLNQVLIAQPMDTSAVLAPATYPSGGSKIEVAPNHLNWWCGRGGQRASLSYPAGWPHTSLTAEAIEAAETLQVDDVTSWHLGWGAFAYDGASTELVQVTAASATTPVILPNGGGTAQAGPGTLTLAAPLQSAHAAGVVVSAMPLDVMHAAALFAAVQALEGIDAIATQSMSGQMAGGTQVLAQSAEMKLDKYVCVI